MTEPTLTSDQLFAIHRAIDFLIGHHRKLHWDMCALMDETIPEGSAQNRMILKLAKEVMKLEEAKSAVSRMFERQCEERK